MATSPELEVLKEQLRRMPASPKKSKFIEQALLLWLPLQERADFERLVHSGNKLNHREIAAEVCATDNIWKKESSKTILRDIYSRAKEAGVFQEAQSGSKGGCDFSKAEGNPITDLQTMRLASRLRKSEGDLYQAKIRIAELEKRLKKYEGLGELERALSQLIKPRR
ncbi:MAG: hypothetical protein JG763_2520 [Shewanella sp.]|jgi:hypothetical protein|uniref:hypothetical protein n=1 Tax=Shewanella sp. TaxID=50422 RepID=UPI001ED50963|nr:hypothetical protein [Shewanella sp.]MBZ4679891.1 hypothetical protein [Shewanella sp.]